MADFLFPSSILLLKFLVKLFVHQQIDKISFTKSIISLPIDIAFLSFTFFSAAYLYQSGVDENLVSVKAFTTFVLGIVSFTILIAACVKSSERMFENDKNGQTFLFSLVATALSISSLVMSVKMVTEI